MQSNFDDVKFIVGTAQTVQKMPELPPMELFSDEVISFFDDLSKSVMAKGRAFSDVVTFGFWCRKASLMQEKNNYDDIKSRLGRGIVFHSTPSNVAVNFAFSFVAGLLAGNANIVRLPAKDFEQVDIICDCINELLNTSHKNLAPYICMVKYSSNQKVSDLFSSICDSRIIWGGDKTIEKWRKSPLKPRANELTFADRYSIAVIDADEYLKSENKSKIAQDFYNDTYFSDQNACTSPRMVIWLGKDKPQAKEEFWGELHKLVKEKYSFAVVQSVGKLNALCKASVALDIKSEKTQDCLLTRIKLNTLDANAMDYKYNSGFFFEYDAEDLNEICQVCTQQCQTMVYYGIGKETLEKFITQSRPQGLDRVVPIGKSMDFSLVWDGYDLIRELSRKILVKEK